jgi:bifunctional DNA-binding transcriptional regulator/antitoxin component of YhaV-PrlF toxin-antitoxin module
MPTIQENKDKKTGQIKYQIILPKEIMETLAVKKGDELIFTGEMGGELRFRLKRK